MRAAVLEAIEAQDPRKDGPELETDDDKLLVEIIRDFLEYANLDRTISVFDPESNCKKKTRQDLLTSLGLKDGEKPVLLQLLQQYHQSNNNNNNNNPKEVSSPMEESGGDYGSDFEEEIASEISNSFESEEEELPVTQQLENALDNYDYIEPAELP